MLKQGNAKLPFAISYRDKNVIAVFQPHRYTRLKSLWNDFLNAFGGVDKVIVTDVYAASEDIIEGINSQKFAAELSAKGINCEYVPGDMKAVAETLYPELKKDDIVIGLGAGTITALGKNLLELNKELTGVAD